MNKNEEAVVMGLKLVLVSQIFAIITWADVMFAASQFRLGIENPSNPQAGGRRSPIKQKEYIQAGLSWWEGPPSEAPHVRGEAIHPIIRHKLTGRAYFYDPETDDADTKEANQLFLLIVEKFEALGWRWLGHGKKGDFQHFEQRIEDPT